MGRDIKIYGLRGKEVFVVNGDLYPNSDPSSEPLTTLKDQTLKLASVVLVAAAAKEAPFAYVDETADTPRGGLWLDDRTNYQVKDPPDFEQL